MLEVRLCQEHRVFFISEEFAIKRIVIFTKIYMYFEIIDNFSLCGSVSRQENFINYRELKLSTEYYKKTGTHAFR